MTKKDDGIAKLHNGLLIPESVRDELLKHDWKGPRSKPSGFDPNQATTKELEEHQFSGFRVNVFTNDVELWCLGRIGTRRSMVDVEKNPSVLASMHEEVFATAGTVVEIPMQIKRAQRRKKHGKTRT